MKKIFTTSNMLNACSCGRVLSLRPILFAVLLPLAAFFFSGNVQAQIAIANTTPVTENFDGIGTGAAATLPANWKFSTAATASPTWGAGGNFTATNNAASAGTPTAVGRYNWGNGTTTTDRALGVMTSAGYATPNSIMAFYSNTNATSNISALTVSYEMERYRINTGAASIAFFYSTDGSTWTSVPAGDIAVITTGANAYDFVPAGAPSSTNAGTITKSGISITGLNIANGGAIYLRWSLSTALPTQGIGIDNVSVTATYTPTITATGSLTAVNTTPGFASAFTSYSLSGIFLTNDITVTPPAGFEVSQVPGGAGPYAATQTLTQVGGVVGPITIYVRLAAATPIGTYSGNVTNVSTGATTVNVAMPASVVANAPTLNAPTVTVTGSTTATLGATVTANGGVALSARGTSFKTSSPVVATDNQLAEGLTAVGAYTHSRSGLSPQTKYWFVGYASNPAATGISGEGTFYTFSEPVTTQAANMVGTPISFSQIDLAWDAAVFPASGATVKGYVLIRATNPQIPTFTSVNGTVPAAGVGTIVSSTILDPAITYSNAGLTQGTTYNYLLVPYTWDGVNAATYNYLTASAATATAITPLAPCTPPVTQVTAALVGGATSGTLNISWTPGSGTNSLVIVRAGSAVSQAPVTGTLYNASATFGAGDNLGSSNFVCYSGAGSSFTLSNLSASTTYYVAVYTYNLAGYCFNLAGPATANGSTTAPASVIETFEPGTKGSYTNGNDLCNLGNWNFSNALIGQIVGSDRFNGAKSARIQSNGSITMLFDKPNGLGTVSVKHALFGTDASTTWRLDVSDDGGATFTAYQSPVQTTNSTTLNTVSFTPNITGNLIRIRIVKLSGGTSSRLNIDDISLGDYVSTNTVTTGAIVGSPFCITNSTGAGVSVPFSSTGTFNAGNVYTAQLSDGTGSFTLAQDIGTLASVANAGVIAASIPAGTVTGSAYKIRVVASDPVITGSASASVLTINLNTPDVTGVSGGPSSGAVTVSWTNPTGCYNDVMVMAFTSSITCVPAGNGSAYTANTVYGSGTACSGAFTVYRNVGNSVVVTGLTNGTIYYFKVFVRNGTVWSTGVEVTAVPSAVADGDYQSHQTGAYNSTTTWEKRVAGAWTYPSPDVPGTGNAGTANVTVNAGHTINLTASAANLAIKTLTVNNTGRIYGSSGTNVYMTLYGDIVCNGTIGTSAVAWNSLSFNMEGVNSTISGSGNFYASRLRKNFAVNTTTNLIIAMNMYLLWNTGSGTTMYNNSTGTNFNVTVNQNATLTAVLAGATSGNMAINSTNGGSSGVVRGGTWTINGTMNIPGILYATPAGNTAGSYSCNWIIGNTGVVNCNQINCDASGVSGHSFTILNGGRLNINTAVGFNTATATSFSATNNTWNLQPGSIVEYSAPSGITHILTDLTYSNLVVSGSGTKDFIASNLSQTGITLTVNRNLTISGSSVLDPSNPGLTNPSNAINVGGNWNNYGTAGFNEAFSNVTFNGFTAGGQKIYCPGGENFYNMTVSNTDAAGAELNTDVTVANDLNLGAVGRLFFGPTPSIMKLTKMTNASNSFLGSGTALVDMSQSASTMYIGCETATYSGGFNAGTTSLVNYYRDMAVSGTSGNQDVLTGITYANLSLSGSDLKKTNADFTVTQTLTIDGSSTSLEANTIGKTLTLGGNLTLSGGGTMGGALGTSCLANLSIATSAASAALAQTFNGGFSPINCFNLTTDKSANGIILNAGNTNLTISNNLTQTTAAQLTPNDNRVKLGNVWSIWGPAAFNKGTSTFEYTGAVAQTIVGVNYFNLESSGTGTRTMSILNPIGIANIFTPFTNVYNFTGSTVDYNGATDQSIAPFTANILTVGRTYDNLTLSNTGIKSLTANTDVEGALTLNNTITFALDANYLGLKSTATQTARVAPVSASASITYGTGRFVAERYYPARRAWRLITAPVTADAAKTLFNSWQVGAASPIGVGTYISGPGETPANGLDVTPQHNYSLKTFNQATSAFDGVGNTKTALISGVTGTAGVPDNIGYFMFVRGDRTPANVNAFNPSGAVVETTLKDTGKIQVQSYTFPANPSIGPNRYTLIGNPYASPVDFASLGRTGVVNKFQAWDPKLNTVGGYVVVDLTAGPAVIVPVGSTQTQIIQSHQAFLVETNNASSPSVSFGEAAKSSTNNLTLFRPVRTIPSVAINLHTVNTDGTSNLADGVLAQYGDQFSAAVDQFDALKFSNINETFAILDNNNAFMLERRPAPRVNDTVFLSLKRSRQLNYRFNVIADNFRAGNLSAYLVDKYKKTSTALSMQGDTWVDFSITGDAASAAADRFYIIFKKAVRFHHIDAVVTAGDITVNWLTENEADITTYEVERSADNEHFEKIATVIPSKTEGTAGYSSVDLNPVPGVYYYRVKGTSNSGAFGYTESVKVKMAVTRSHLYVYPNPVTGGSIGLQMSSLPAGAYAVKLVATNGQVLLNTKLQHSKDRAAEMITYPSSITPGTYQLEVTGPDKVKSALSVVIGK